ncbi:MAG TPA: Crp/Fnr family transcriptional regulator [Terriglobales bacterium]|nr:Crp/Fnr family transcriptional regulator [Terriglobales bacterium]
MRVSSRAASRRAGAFAIRRTVQPDANLATRVVRCKNAQASAIPRLHQIQPQTLNVDPLYLFHCGVRWHQQTDTSAGWELIHALKSSDIRTRMVAGSFLAKTDGVHVLARDVRRAAKQAIRQSPEFKTPIRTNEVQEMNTPYGLEIIESCVSCKLRKDKWFCGFSSETLKAFSGSSHLSTYPGGALLFVEGQTPRGAYVLCSGRVKLSTTSRDGKVLILRMADAGELLGLSAVISGEAYLVTAETAGPCHVNFIERENFLKLMEKNGEIGLRSAQMLSRDFQSMYRDVHDLVLARSSAGKLARLLLSWTPGMPPLPGKAEERIRAAMTHEEMAQMIGSSRETVTRLLSDLKKKELIRLEGSTLVIRNRPALEALAA